MSLLRLSGLAGVAVLVFLGYLVVVEPAWYLRLRYPLRYPNTIVTHASNYDLPPELVAAVIMQESRFEVDARSGAGAVGLMQLTPDTARGIALRTGGRRFETDDLLDPEINIRYGCWYLRHLHQKFDRDDEDRYIHSLAAYNAGQGRVQGWLDDQEDGKLSIEEIPFRETREYVRNVTDMTAKYRKAYPRLR